MNDLPPWMFRQNLVKETHLALLLLILTSLYIIWAAHPVWEQQWLNDDSFITLTYAKNLVNGNGFIYNQPPATLGTTTPLFTLLTALLTLLIPGSDVIESAIILSVASCLGTGLMIYLTARQLRWRSLASATVAIIPITIINGEWLWFIGMETWLFQFLLVLSFYLCLADYPKLAGLTVGLLFLTRGEGILVGGILGGYLLLTRKRIPIEFIMGGLLIVSLWAIYAFFTFGSILPNTLTAKVAHQEYFLQHGREDRGFFPVAVGRLTFWLQSFNLGSTLGSNVLLLSLILGLYALSFGKQYQWGFFLLWGGAYFLAYTIIDPATYPWYTLHLFFVLEVVVGVGIGWILQSALNEEGTKRVLRTLGGVALALLLLIPNIYRGIDSVETFPGDVRAIRYKAVAEWLSQHTRPEDSVAYLEVGYLGYYTQNRIIDLAGLIDPVIASNLAENDFTWGFWHYRPKYFLYNPAYDNDFWLARIRAATTQYEEVARFPLGETNETLVLFRQIEESRD